MIDIHTHILPGLDDGAQNLEQSLAMARIAVKDGITTLVATPHVMAPTFDNSRADILEAVKEFNQLINTQEIPLKVLPGAEYYLTHELPRLLANGELVTINDTGKYLLIEFPTVFSITHAANILYEIQLQGVTPIIAHPERNSTFSGKPRLLEDLVFRDMLAQVTSLSITGLFGRKTRNTALKFIKKGTAHLIASDAHSANHRAPLLRDACNELERRYGTTLARNLTYEIPNKIIT